VTLGGIAEVHGERSGEDDEGLLLELVPVAAPFRARLVPPEVRTGVREAGVLAQLRDMTWRFFGLVWTGRPLEPVGTDDAKGHAGSLITAGRDAPHLLDLMV
jgi:hypothetical protein